MRLTIDELGTTIPKDRAQRAIKSMKAAALNHGAALDDARDVSCRRVQHCYFVSATFNGFRYDWADY